MTNIINKVSLITNIIFINMHSLPKTQNYTHDCIRSIRNWILYVFLQLLLPPTTFATLFATFINVYMYLFLIICFCHTHDCIRSIRNCILYDYSITFTSCHFCYLIWNFYYFCSWSYTIQAQLSTTNILQSWIKTYIKHTNNVHTYRSSWKPNQTKHIQHIPLRAGSGEGKMYVDHGPTPKSREAVSVKTPGLVQDKVLCEI